MIKTFCIVAFIFVLTYGFLNLGVFLDKSQEAKKSDIIISLGGDNNHRIKKAIQLYENNFSKENIILMTGGTDFTKKDKNQDSRIKYINSLNKEINYIYNPNTKSTLQELKYLKKYMKENDYKKAIIISDAFHTRRISIIVDILDFDEDIELAIVKTDISWWDNKEYYKNSLALKLAFTEVIKIPYNYIKYMILRG